MRLQNGVTGLHDLLIPLSWISPNSGLTDRSKDRGMPNFGVLFQGLIGELLNDLWNAEGESNRLMGLGTFANVMFQRLSTS
jgi:hypothetical protein